MVSISETGVAGCSWATAATRADASAIAPFEFMRLPYAALLGYLFFGEQPDLWTWVGAAIIVACETALIGFGTLINSSYGPLHVFGIVSIVTLTCCLTASIVSLPALVVEMERWSRSAR